MKKVQKKAVVMTDEQIEAGLTACSGTDEIGCKKCPYKAHKLYSLCLFMLLTDLSAYIKRLKGQPPKN